MNRRGFFGAMRAFGLGGGANSLAHNASALPADVQLPHGGDGDDEFDPSECSIAELSRAMAEGQTSNIQNYRATREGTSG
jgi:hypothetical protein